MLSIAKADRRGRNSSSSCCTNVTFLKFFFCFEVLSFPPCFCHQYGRRMREDYWERLGMWPCSGGWSARAGKDWSYPKKEVRLPVPLG